MAIFADWANAITDDSGLAIGAVQISVRNPINNALITIFSDAAGTVRANPFTTDATGVVRFFVDISVNSHIRVEAVKTGFDFTVWNSLFNNVRLAHGVPRGADRTVQYRRGDAFAGDADFTWDEVAKRLSVTSLIASVTGNALTLSGAGANIAFTGAGLAQITTAAAQHLALMPGGNVGIGTAAPDRRLHVETGELRVRASHNTPVADIGTFFAENLSQGIGIGFNRIEAIGSNVNQDILILPRGTGNVGIGTAAPAHPIHHGSGAHLTAAGVWTNVSSRQLKTNFEAVSVLDKLANLPIQRYAYKKFESEKDAEGKEKLDENDRPIRKWKNKAVHADKHISPVAEDMHTIFGVGSKDGLAAIDVAGVALQGVKELLARVVELEKRVK